MLYKTVLSHFLAELRDLHGPIPHSFVDAVIPKLEKGFKEYGDKSFERTVEEIFGELGQEALDLFGWSLIGYKIATAKEDYRAVKRFLEIANVGITLWGKTRAKEGK